MLNKFISIIKFFFTQLYDLSNQCYRNHSLYVDLEAILVHYYTFGAAQRIMIHENEQNYSRENEEEIKITIKGCQWK